MTPAPTSFTFEPLFLALAVVCAYLYVRWLRQRHAPVPWWRPALFFAGLALIAASLNSPLETIAAHYLLMMHLLQNVAIADWAPPLLIIGLAPAMRAALAERGGRMFAAITRPKVALPIWLVGWYVIHLALVYDYALENSWALNAEHAALIAIGLIFWWPVFSDSPHGPSTVTRLAYVLAGFVGSVFLGLAFTFSGSAFYDFYEKAPRLWGLSPQQDQNYGGILMTTEQAIVFLAALAWLLTKLFHEETARERELSERQRREGY